MESPSLRNRGLPARRASLPAPRTTSEELARPITLLGTARSDGRPVPSFSARGCLAPTHWRAVRHRPGTDGGGGIDNEACTPDCAGGLADTRVQRERRPVWRPRPG